MREAPPTGRGGHTPLPPHSGRKSYSREASFADCRKNAKAPPPSQEFGGGKVLSGPGPSLPGGPARPLAAGGPGRCRPSPSRRPLSRPPGHAPGLPEPLPESRLPPFPTYLPGRLCRSPLTPPAATVHTHRLRSRTIPHSHTARPRLQSGPHIMRQSRATCAARARAGAPSRPPPAPPRFRLGGRIAGRRREGNAGASRGLLTNPEASWEMKFRF